VSYDSPEILERFAEKYKIGYPLLSDKGSKVIREFGILNSNVPPDHPFYGIPFPGFFFILILANFNVRIQTLCG